VPSISCDDVTGHEKNRLGQGQERYVSGERGLFMEPPDFGLTSFASSSTNSNLSARRVNTSRMSANEFEPIEGQTDHNRITVNVRTVTADFVVQISRNAKISQLKDEVLENIFLHTWIFKLL
jgi:hypothetical protein